MSTMSTVPVFSRPLGLFQANRFASSVMVQYWSSSARAWPLDMSKGFGVFF